MRNLRGWLIDAGYAASDAPAPGHPWPVPPLEKAGDRLDAVSRSGLWAR